MKQQENRKLNKKIEINKIAENKEKRLIFNNKNEFITFGFKSESEYYDFLKMINIQIEAKRKEMGFKICSDKANYDIRKIKQKMFNDMFEMEVYEELKKHVFCKKYNEAWDKFKNSQKYNERFVDNIEEYQRAFKKIFDKINKNVWDAEEVIKFIKINEEKINKKNNLKSG